jgi:hypothetical protein
MMDKIKYPKTRHRVCRKSGIYFPDIVTKPFKTSNNDNSSRFVGGYVRVRLKTYVIPAGDEQTVLEETNKKNKAGSICVFIAGGSAIDAKVAEANIAVQNILKQKGQL